MGGDVGVKPAKESSYRPKPNTRHDKHHRNDDAGTDKRPPVKRKF